MDKRREMRASDADRQAVVERLSSALDEGRLKLHEYDERVVRAWESVTYGDLVDLFTDLPNSGTVVKLPDEPVAVTTPVAPVQPVHHGSDVPLALRILWTIWLTGVLVNLVVWTLVSINTGHAHYFWPMWVIGPPGAALTAVTVGIVGIKRSRREAAIRRGLEAASRKQKNKRR
jgi:hypothetical protein